MKKFNVDSNDIESIFLTHLHGDHFVGTIFFLMEARYVAARKAPLIIAGPKGVKQRIIDTMNLMYPGCWDKSNDFKVIFVELTKEHRQCLNGVGVTPFSAKHLQDGNDFILRFDVEGKIITYSGDTGWTDELIPASKGTDLTIIESYFYKSECEFHLDYETIIKNREKLEAKQLILTHLGPDAMLHMDSFTLPVAFDGMKISV